MSSNEQSTIALVFGRKHCGKTTLLKKMIRRARFSKSVLVIDKLNKFKDPDATFFYHADRVFEYGLSNQKFYIVLTTADEGHIRAAIVAAYLLGNVTVIYDEADTTFGNNLDPAIRDVILRGRNQGIDLILTALRPLKIGVDTRNQADQVYCFNVVNKGMVESIASEFGQREIIGMVGELDYKNYEYLKIDIRENTTEIFVNGKNADDRSAYFQKYA